MRKTIRLTVFICIILLSFALVFTACNNNEDPLSDESSSESETQESETQKPNNNNNNNSDDTSSEHIHSWGEWEIIAPATCISEGEQRCYCECGELQIEYLLMTEHIQTTGPLVAVAPTCKDKGLTEGKMCAVCGEIVVAQEEIPATGHYETEINEPATCTETGLSGGKKCLLCNVVTKAPKTVAALGHNMKTVEGTPATHETDGLTDGHYCDRCEDREDGVARQEIIPAGHQWVPYEQPATCTSMGRKGERCSISTCHEWNTAEDATVPFEKTPVIPHSFENGICAGCGANESGTLVNPYSLVLGTTYEIEAEGAFFYTYTAEGDVTLNIAISGSDAYNVYYDDNSQAPLTITLTEGQTIVIRVENYSVSDVLSFVIETN